MEPQATSSPLDLSSLAPMLSKKQTIVLTPAGRWFDGTKLLTMVLPQTCECQKRLWWNPGFQEDESHLHVCSNGHPWSWGYPKLWFQFNWWIQSPYGVIHPRDKLTVAKRLAWAGEWYWLKSYLSVLVKVLPWNMGLLTFQVKDHNRLLSGTSWLSVLSSSTQWRRGNLGI